MACSARGRLLLACFSPAAASLTFCCCCCFPHLPPLPQRLWHRALPRRRHGHQGGRHDEQRQHRRARRVGAHRPVCLMRRRCPPPPCPAACRGPWASPRTPRLVSCRAAAVAAAAVAHLAPRRSVLAACMRSFPPLALCRFRVQHLLHFSSFAATLALPCTDFGCACAGQELPCHSVLLVCFPACYPFIMREAAVSLCTLQPSHFRAEKNNVGAVSPSASRTTACPIVWSTPGHVLAALKSPCVLSSPSSRRC